MTEGVARLKELLFDSESQSIADLDGRLEQVLSRLGSLEGVNQQAATQRQEIAKRVDQLFETSGSRERFASSVASVLDDALRQAEVKNHRDVADAMAPLVIQTIRSELLNSQDELVEVLYPITGRMVKSYVATAMRDLARDLNRRVEQNGLMLRLRSMVSGKSVAELAIVESQHLKVEEVFLIRRGSGELLARWPSGREMSNSDIHMSGVLSAINDFASHAFQEDGGNLRTFEIDDFTVYLRASPVYLVAAKCRGVAPSGVNAIIDEEFLNLLDRVGNNGGENANQFGAKAQPKDLAPLAEGVEDRTTQIYADNKRAGLAFSPLKALLFLLAIPMFAGLLWWGYVTMERSQALNQARTVLASVPELQGYPTTLDVGYRGRDIRVSGLAPDKVVAERLRQKLIAALPQSKVDAKLAILPKRENVDQSQLLAGLRSEIAAVEIEAKRRGVQQALERTNQRLMQAREEFERISGRLTSSAQRERLATVKARIARVGREIDTYMAVARANARDLTTLQNLNTPLHGLSGLIGMTATEVAALADNTVPKTAATHQASPPSDVSVTAEYLESQAQRLATTAIAVSQALLFKQPKPVAAATTDLDRLKAFTERNAIFFANGTDFRDPAAASAKLDELVKLLSPTRATIRVAGYTDGSGGANRNNPLAQSRADKVTDALLAKGVPRDRIISVGRANAVNLSNSTGPRSSNRRAQFEVAFVGETGGQ